MKMFLEKNNQADNQSGEKKSRENSLIQIHTRKNENNANEGENKGTKAQSIVGYINNILQCKGRDGIAGMADLEKIGINEIRNINEKDEGGIININGFGYNITRIEDRDRMPDGNYYDPKAKKFLVKNNKSDDYLLEYSPYRKYEKIYEKKRGEVFGKDDLLIKGFVGKIGKVLSDNMNNDPETGMLLDYSSEYEDMIGRYDIGIGYFEGEIKNKYGFENYVGFEGIGIFKLDNGVILSGNFGIEYYLDTKKIFGSGKIIYPDGKEEIGSRGGEGDLYEKIYPEDDL